jgi:hypothetical protein
MHGEDAGEEPVRGEGTGQRPCSKLVDPARWGCAGWGGGACHLVLPVDLALGVDDLGDEVGGVDGAAVGNRRVQIGQLEGAHLPHHRVQSARRKGQTQVLDRATRRLARQPGNRPLQRLAGLAVKHTCETLA